MSELFSNSKGVDIVMDDILMHTPTAEEHDKILAGVLKICGKNP